MDDQRWLIKYEIANSKAIEAWLDVTTPRPAADHADVIAEVDRFRQTEQDHCRAEVRQICKEVLKPSQCQMLQKLCVKQLKRLSGGDAGELEQVNSDH